MLPAVTTTDGLSFSVLPNSPGLGIVELTVQLFIAGLVLGCRPGYPGIIQVVLQRDILVADVAGPDPAPHAGSHRHAVCEAAGIGLGLGLTDHHPADRCRQRQLMDVFVIETVDAA